MASSSHPLRIIVHIDVDAFYSQVEELRDPSLRGRPLAVTQKYLVVTCNYAARARGVTKLMATAAARSKCPELVCVCGEDLTPYRAASKAVRAALAQFGVVQKLGLDEFDVDVSLRAREAQRAAALAGVGMAPCWHGHVHAAEEGTSTAEAEAGSASRLRPMDLRAHGAAAGATSSAVATLTTAYTNAPAAGSADELLMLGTAIAAEARAAVLASTGLRCSAGIAHNRLLAKVAFRTAVFALLPSLATRLTAAAASAADARLFFRVPSLLPCPCVRAPSSYLGCTSRTTRQRCHSRRPSPSCSPSPCARCPASARGSSGCSGRCCTPPRSRSCARSRCPPSRARSRRREAVPGM